MSRTEITDKEESENDEPTVKILTGDHHDFQPGKDQEKAQEQKPEPDTETAFGWVIVFASFLIQFIEDGVFFSFGLFFVHISKEFSDSGKSAASWIASIMIAVTHAVGPLSSLLVTQYGCRNVSILGSLIVAIGYSTSYFAQNVETLYLTIGVIGGLGFGFVYLPAIVIVPQYFKRRRAFAVGISVCGSGLGILAFEYILGLILAAYPWRESLVITGGIMLITAVVALLYGPKPKPAEQISEPNDFLDTKDKMGMQKISKCQALMSMLDLSLMRNPCFVLFAFGDMISSIGFNVPYIYLPEIEQTLEGEGSKSTLLGIIGVTNIFGRLFFGYVSDCPGVNRLTLYNTTLILAGIATMLSPHLANVWLLRGYSALFGTGIGTYTSLKTVILVDLIGIERLTAAFGLFLLVQSMGFIIGPPIVGLLYDLYGTYREGFYFAGASFIVSGALLFLIPLLKARHDKNKNLKELRAAMAEDAEETELQQRRSSFLSQNHYLPTELNA